MSTATHVLDGPQLEALLARVPVELGPEAQIVAANKVRTGGLAGFFAKERYEVVVEVPQGAVLPVARAASPARLAASPAPVVQDPRGFAGVLDRLVRDAGAEDGPALAEETEAFVPMALADHRADHVTDHVMDHVTDHLAGRATPPRVPAALAAALPVTLADTLPSTLDQGWLSQMGIPATLTPVGRSTREELVLQLLGLMEQVPQVDPLPQGPGSVVAVVGPRHQALEIARQLADDLGADPDEVLVATNDRRVRTPEALRIDDADEASRHRRSWRRRRTPTLVAVDAPAGLGQLGWAAAVVDALEPTMAWGVVAAGRKPEDVSEWASRLGGLDALAVHGLEETCSPAAILSVGVPVGLLDGEVATPIRWTALLAAHLQVAA